MTTKQRSKLRSLAQTLEPIGQIGKGGISDNMLTGLSSALDARELIKITVLKNAEDDARFLADDLADALDAEVVCTIGHKIVLYRRSLKYGGELYVVGNRHLDYFRKLKRAFGNCTTIATNNKFVILKATKVRKQR